MNDLRESALNLAHRDEEIAAGGVAPEPEKVVIRAIAYARFLLGRRDIEIFDGNQADTKA